MSEMKFTIRHGQFHDVNGISRRFNDISFVPALVTLNGMWFQSSSDLKDCMTDVPAIVTAIVHPGMDAPWVQGRLIRLFQLQPVPEDERTEKTCLYASFLAVLHHCETVAIPFECSDYYGKTGLTFSTDDAPDKEMQVIIANAFWKMLLSDPTDIADFEGMMCHSGTGIWTRFGVEDGEPFMHEDTER